jgi:hypothetical protein
LAGLFGKEKHMDAIMETAVTETRADILAKARDARRTGARNSITMIENAPQNRLSHLDPTRRSFVAKRLADMPKSARNTYLRAMGGRSPRAGIKAFCNECCGWQRAEVARCTALACPLYPYRPFQDVA